MVFLALFCRSGCPVRRKNGSCAIFWPIYDTSLAPIPKSI
jgi:hypothetical protein